MPFTRRGEEGQFTKKGKKSEEKGATTPAAPK